MPVYTAEIWVDEPAERVWEVLVDFDGYPEWNPFTPRVRTTLEIGDPVALTTDLAWITVTQREVVREVVPYERLVWGGVLYAGLIHAERVQTLEADGDRTRYRTRDAITGPAAWVVSLLFSGPLTRGFQAMAAALAERAKSKFPKTGV